MRSNPHPSPSTVAHEVLREVAASPHHGLESRQRMALLAALVEIGD